MDATSRNNALEICALLKERSAMDVIGLEMGPGCSWASHLVIGTITSRVHMQGLSSTVKDKIRELGMETRSGGKKSDESSWRIIDGGDVVVSLMDTEARNYYALEERWFEAEVIFGATGNTQSNESKTAVSQSAAYRRQSRGTLRQKRNCEQ